MTNHPLQVIEVRRGGTAQYFIYLPVLLLLGLINKVLNIPPPYLYGVFMAVGVGMVMSMNTLSALVFTKVIIRATKEGIWTNHLNLVPWNQIKEIRLDKTSTFNTGTMSGSTSIDLVIETNDHRVSSFWGSFLNQDPTALCTALNNLWQANK